MHWLVEHSCALVCASGIQRSSMPKWCLLPSSQHALVLISIYSKSIKTRPSIIGYVATSIALVGNGEREKAYQTCDIAFERFQSSHSTFLLLIKACLFRAQFSPNCSFHLGYCQVHGRGAQRGDSASGPAYRQGPLEPVILCSSGTCTTRYHEANISTDTCTRHICPFCLEIPSWRAATPRVQYSRSSVSESTCDTARVGHSGWSHWQGFLTDERIDIAHHV